MIDAMTPMAGSNASEVQRLQISHAGWTTTFSNGDLAAAASHLEVGLSIYAAEKHHQSAFHYGGHDPGVCARCHCDFVRSLTGNLDAGRRCGAEALVLAERLAHENSLTVAYALGALGRYFVRDPVGARDLSRKAAAVRAKYGPRIEVLATCVGAWAEEILGESTDGVEQLREGVALSMAPGAVMRMPFYALMLAEILNRRGEHHQAAETIDTALEVMAQYQAGALAAEAYRLRGEAEAGLGRAQAAETSFRTAIDHAHRQGAKLLELRAYVSLIRSGVSRRSLEAAECLGSILKEIVSNIESADTAEAKYFINYQRCLFADPFRRGESAEAET